MAQSTTARPVDQGHPRPAPKRRVRKGTRSTLSSMGTLARWQLRQTWSLLIVIGMGLIAAVALVGMIPLYAQVSESAGLRHALAADPQSAYIQIQANNPLFDSGSLNDIQSQLTQIIQGALGPTIVAPPDLSVQVSSLDFTPNTRLKAPGQVSSFVRLVGADVSHATGHLKLLQGRLPRTTSPGVIEFAAPIDTQQSLQLQPGKNFTLPYDLTDQVGTITRHTLTLRLVGVFAPFDSNSSDPFWHGENFVPDQIAQGANILERFPLLVSNQEIMNELTALSSTARQQDRDSIPQFTNLPETSWYYRFDFSRVDVNRLPDLTNSLNSVLGTINHSPQEPPYVEDTTSQGPFSVLRDYAQRVTVIALPILALTYLIGGLLLFFVVLMTDLLVERQVTAITLLRSRGASARQVFGSLLWQSIVLALIAFVAGPLLAIFLVALLVHVTLPPTDLVSLNLITANPLTEVRVLTQRDLIIVGLAVLAMILATWRVMRSNILLLRRETARTTQQPFWMRFKLDIVAAVLALAGFGFTIYIVNSGVLDVAVRVLILPVTSLAGVACLLLAALLLFLRFFPAVLRLGEHLAGRNRGIAPMLALAQMARSPRQSLRMTLLFALAVAFSLFTLLFSATQLQRLPDLTNYQVGGDISGQISPNLEGLPYQQQLDFFTQIKGVTSVTLAATRQVTGGQNDVSIDLRAVDTSTYASTIYWTAQDSDQPIRTLTNELIARRAAAEKRNIIPAIIDDAAAQSLGVSVGKQFVLQDQHGPTTYEVIAIVHYIPTIYDTASATGSATPLLQGGVLVDFATQNAVSTALTQEELFPDTAWLRTTDNPAELANIRKILFTGTYQLGLPQDRRAILASLANDPLAEAMIGILAIGAAVALLFALLGTLLVSWLNARSRRISFAVMRALGCTPRQIIAILLWEQGITYGVALALGVGLSILFALLILPSFVFTPLSGGSVATFNPEAFYIVQSVPVVHVVVPIVPVAAVLGGLVLVCAVTLGMMVRVVTRPHMSQELRVDED